MKSFLGLALIGVASAYETLNESDVNFMKFIVKFNKSYAHLEEFNKRKANFVITDERIAALNAFDKYAQYGHNIMSDWSDEEY